MRLRQIEGAYRSRLVAGRLNRLAIARRPPLVLGLARRRLDLSSGTCPSTSSAPISSARSSPARSS